MEIKQQAPMNRNMITIVVVVLLCGAGFAYSQGWFNAMTTNSDMEIKRDGTEQVIEQENTPPPVETPIR